MKERVLAEAELLDGEIYRVIRDEHGDYFTERIEDEERTGWRFHLTLSAALAHFGHEVEYAEHHRLIEEIAKERSN